MRTAQATPAQPISAQRKRRLLKAGGVTLLVMLGALTFIQQRFFRGIPLRTLAANLINYNAKIDTPHPLATWPWRGAKKDTPYPGVTHWIAHGSDGTVVELFDFDFGANPNLRFEIYDQDEDDRVPFDNKVEYWDRGVGSVTRRLNQKFASSNEGKIVAAWNGLFFGYAPNTRGRVAFHVSPVVLRGKVYYTRKSHRWTFGVKYKNGRPVFKVFHLPSVSTLSEEFDYAAGSAQCLIKDGRLLKLQPFPAPATTPIPAPVKSTPQEAGHIPHFDHMKSSRASLGWTKDNRHLYLLFVKELDSESGSIFALNHRMPMGSGWMVVDLQRFWQALKVPYAINSDAGDVAQHTYLRPDGKYELVPSRQGSGAMRMTFSPEFKNAPQGGAIMYLYIRDSKQ